MFFLWLPFLGVGFKIGLRMWWTFWNAPLSHEVGCSVIKEAFQRGITSFDIADVYLDNYDKDIMVGKVLLLSNHIERKNVILAHTLLACRFIDYVCLVSICIQLNKVALGTYIFEH